MGGSTRVFGGAAAIAGRVGSLCATNVGGESTAPESVVAGELPRYRQPAAPRRGGDDGDSATVAGTRLPRQLLIGAAPGAQPGTHAAGSLRAGGVQAGRRGAGGLWLCRSAVRPAEPATAARLGICDDAFLEPASIRRVCV